MGQNLGYLLNLIKESILIYRGLPYYAPLRLHNKDAKARPFERNSCCHGRQPTDRPSHFRFRHRASRQSKHNKHNDGRDRRVARGSSRSCCGCSSVRCMRSSTGTVQETRSVWPLQVGVVSQCGMSTNGISCSQEEMPPSHSHSCCNHEYMCE